MRPKYTCSSTSHRCWWYLCRVIFQNENNITYNSNKLNILMLWVKRRKTQLLLCFLLRKITYFIHKDWITNHDIYYSMNVTFCQFSMQNSTNSFSEYVLKLHINIQGIIMSTKILVSPLIGTARGKVTQEMFSGNHIRSRCETVLNEIMKLHNTPRTFFSLIEDVHWKIFRKKKTSPCAKFSTE